VSAAPGPGRMLLGDDVEKIARAVWKDELEGARLTVVARRMADVRDTLDDLPDVPVTQAEAAKIRELARLAQLVTGPTFDDMSGLDSI
jgi:hypothetical protein